MDIQYVKNDYFSQVEFLYKLSSEKDSNRELFTNLIVIDIVTNLEVYIERLLNQFFKKYNEVGMPLSKIEKKLKIEHTKVSLGNLEKIIVHAHKEDDSIALLKKISSMWRDGSEEILPIEVGVKFPRGKHGEVQIESLFEKMNIPNVLSKIIIEKPFESLIDDSKLDLSVFIQEITNKRNLAIHEGALLHQRVTLKNLRYVIDTTDELLTQLTDLVNSELMRHRKFLLV